MDEKVEERRYAMESDIGLPVCVKESQMDEWRKTQSTDPKVIKAKRAKMEAEVAALAEKWRGTL